MAFFTKEFKGQKYFSNIEFDHIEFYSGNAKQAAFFYQKTFGFELYAYCGPETGVKSKVSYVLRKNKVFFVITTPIKSDHIGSNWLLKHGDGVFNIAFKVDSVSQSFNDTVSRGAEVYSDISKISNKDGVYESAAIRSYGDCIHTFVNREKYNGLWAPNYISIKSNISTLDTKIILIDHIVANVENDKMDYWKEYYEKIFGFSTFVRFDETDISTKYSSLKSVVVRSENWKVKLPINEPAEGLKKSQIEEYLDFNEGPGIQHIALLTSDILHTVSLLRDNGVDFLELPDTYYEILKSKNIKIDESIDKLKNLGILVDNDEEGYLLQLFTKPVQDRPTLFIELIQRKGSRGFGQGNFQSLFESIELEQERRGNL